MILTWNRTGILIRINAHLYNMRATKSKLSSESYLEAEMRIKILYRKSLRMSPGKLAAQAVHAALGLNERYSNISVSLDPKASVVVLGASAAKFYEAEREHQPAYVVHDAGRTEVPAGTPTCIAFLEDDPKEDHLHEENSYGVCRVCAQRKVAKEEPHEKTKKA